MSMFASGWWLALLALFAGGNLALGLKDHFELNKSGLVHFIIFVWLLLLVLAHPLL